jgi:putative DNA methylase
MTYRKKLIEVALPLEAINKESAREKSIRHGHPSTLHLWWARRPLAACRAVLFASLVDDPSSLPEQFPTEEAQQRERDRLFKIIEELVRWENSNNEAVLDRARKEILRSTGGNPPPVLDPFAGGGSIPLEAQRLGLEAHASDLNPVAVLINKALIEIPPRFAGQPPVNPESRKKIGNAENWRGAQGLAEDVRFYGKWMRDEAEKRIGHLYPKIDSPTAKGLTVIAWLWARTVRCPNPACGARMPLVRSFALSTKKGKQAWVEPIIEFPVTLSRSEGSLAPNSRDASQAQHDGVFGRGQKRVRFEVRTGEGSPPEGTVNRKGARCLVCGTSVPFDHVRAEGKAGRMSQQMMAVVAEGQRGRVYLDPTPEQVEIAQQAKPTWKPDAELPHNPRDFKTPNYGMRTFGDLFTPRQLVALTTFSDLVGEARQRVAADAQAARLDEARAQAYADAVATYLAFALSKMADRGSTICTWFTERDSTRNTFARQAIPMTWDFAELNTLLKGTGSFVGAVDWTAESLEGVPLGSKDGFVKQADATKTVDKIQPAIISTDPPYYDNIGYADLADFFYVWLRRSLGSIYPTITGTLLVPKAQELVATPYRFGGSKQKAQEFFEHGLGEAFERMCEAAHRDYPLTVYYAFKQAESDGDEGSGDGDGIVATASTGWETMLEGLLRSGFAINGTWPMRSELSNRMIASGTNALASSIVLVCRPRPQSAAVATRREFIAALRRELPDALRKLQHGNIAPVDLAQAAIGPGMAVFSRYSKVVESNGEPMRVRTALQLINQSLDEVLQEQEGEYDNDTRWAIAWFEQYAANEGPYGEAETLSRAKNTSVAGLHEGGVVQARAGKVRLLSRDQLPDGWNPTQDRRKSVWEITQHLIRALENDGEYGAAGILAQLGSEAEAARDLAYRLYTTCERKGWASEALAYNSLVVAWPAILEQKSAQPGRIAQSRIDY